VGVRERLLVWEHPVNERRRRASRGGSASRTASTSRSRTSRSGKDATLEERDYSVIQVLDHLSRMQVARYRSRIPIHDCRCCWRCSSRCTTTGDPRAGGHGPGDRPVDALAKDYRYPLYRRRRAGDDQRADSREQLLGWQTDTRTKPLMEQTFGRR
jgi:hypothetical protein